MAVLAKALNLPRRTSQLLKSLKKPKQTAVEENYLIVYESMKLRVTAHKMYRILR